MFLMHRLLLYSGLWLLPEIDPIASQCGGHVMWFAIPACCWQIDITPLTPFWSHWECLSAVDTFSGYSVVAPIWSANSDHTVVALETNLCRVFRLSDHVHLDSGLPLISKATQQLADSQGIQWAFRIPSHPWTLFSIVECWNGQKKKKGSKHFWPSHFSWFTHLSGLVTE